MSEIVHEISLMFFLVVILCPVGLIMHKPQQRKLPPKPRKFSPQNLPFSNPGWMAVTGHCHLPGS